MKPFQPGHYEPKDGLVMPVPTLEAQVRELGDMGISFNLPEEALITKLREHADPAAYERDPYHLLLSIAGTEWIDADGGVFRLSDDVLRFDLECVEDPDVYTDIVRKFIALARGDVQIDELECSVDFDAGEARLAFTYEGERRELDVRFDHDWFDVTVLERIAAIVRKPGREFACAEDAQTVTILYGSAEMLGRLNRAANNRFRVLGGGAAVKPERKTLAPASGTNKAGLEVIRTYPPSHYCGSIAIIFLALIGTRIMSRLGELDTRRLTFLFIFGAPAVLWLLWMVIRSARTERLEIAERALRFNSKAVKPQEIHRITLLEDRLFLHRRNDRTPFMLRLKHREDFECLKAQLGDFGRRNSVQVDVAGDDSGEREQGRSSEK